MKPVVSIIIPVYNVDRYISRCIDSILSQTLRDWELIAINDGSTDNSLSELNKYANDPRIKILDIPNGGVVNARETGLSQATGKYLLFVDADDYIPSDALEQMSDVMKKENSDMVIGSYTLLWESDGRTKLVDNPKNIKKVDDCISYCIRNGETFLPVKMYILEKFKKVVSIPHHVIFMEDTIGVLQYLKSCRTVSVLDTSVYTYFKRSGSASMNIKEKTVESMLHVSEFLMAYREDCSFSCRKEIDKKIASLLYTSIVFEDRIKNKISDLAKLIDRFVGANTTLRGCKYSVLRCYLIKPKLAKRIINFSQSILNVKWLIKRVIWKIIHK